MIARHLLSLALLALMGLLVLPLTGTALAQGTRDEQLAQLQQRFRQRYPELLRLKRAGTVGETWQGYIESVRAESVQGEGKPAKDLRAFIEVENRDRRQLYQIMAEREGSTPEHVAQLNASRNFKNAEEGWYLKGRDGKWFQKTRQEEEQTPRQ